MVKRKHRKSEPKVDSSAITSKKIKSVGISSDSPKTVSLGTLALSSAISKPASNSNITTTIVNASTDKERRKKKSASRKECAIKVKAALSKPSSSQPIRENVVVLPEPAVENDLDLSSVRSSSPVNLLPLSNSGSSDIYEVLFVYSIFLFR